ncbi:Zinc-binding alcohol dehydrogenase domain-containing protein cipB [Colletotrichum tanaceti]|uniref:Zinc-binding alcohol dehydrogenase domain-containing protein cipB n=1 Tax=Colletotrichum tanaceti TaxID=1306861 RepID=A0A4U6XJG5_9PEZI|nr:Zinc-binding alcohol dehydrogenase domain-containing protein cipB [Colletotrichum tanaceti]TKW55649.1 Zinc-binding alcohol dehydrogenase domain-containing protein cipB [Colletotrichum tanaceti]
MVRTSYAPSTFYETSTVCSFEKEPEVTSVSAAAAPKERRSMRQRVKRALRDVGHPPTYRYDLEHGVETRRTVPVGPMGYNVLNQPNHDIDGIGAEGFAAKIIQQSGSVKLTDMAAIPKRTRPLRRPPNARQLILVDHETRLPDEGEVLIQNQWTASSPLDLHRADGGLLCTYPEAVGGGAADTVVAVGPGVERLRAGDQIFTFAFRDFGERAHQDFATVPEYLVSKLPANVTPQEAATVPTSLITEKDDAVLAWGAASSVGVYAVQVLRHWGYRNILAVASEKHHAHLKEIGAGAIFSYRDNDIVNKLVGVVGSEGVPFVLDCIGSVEGTLRPLAKIARKGTKVAVMLPVIVRDSTEDVDPEYEMDVSRVLTDEWAEGVELRGVRTHFYLANRFFNEKMQREIVPTLLEQGVIKPNKQRIVEGATMLERAQKAIELLRRKYPSGERLVWKVSDLKL